MTELDLIADESLKFDAILRDRKEYLGVWESRLWHDGDHTIKNFFDVNFGVRTKDGNVCKFVLILYHLWNNTYKKGNFIVIVNIIMSFLKFIIMRKYNSYINKHIGKKQTQRMYIL